MNKTLNGPAINFSPGEFDKIIIFLHGYGANGNALISIAHEWKSHITNTLFVSPNAPFKCPWGGDSYQWFELTSVSPEKIGEGLKKAGPYLNKFIDDLILQHTVTLNKIFFVGFLRPRRRRMQRRVRIRLQFSKNYIFFRDCSGFFKDCS